MNQATLVFPIYEDTREVVLATKVGKICDGRLNGYGGKIELGETPETAARREFMEESGGAEVRPEDLSQVALGVFHNRENDGSISTWEVHTFLARAWFGQIRSTQTMRNPTRYRFDEIQKLPSRLFVPGDREWLPKILMDYRYYTEHPMLIQITYGPGQKEILGSVSMGTLGW